MKNISIELINEIERQIDDCQKPVSYDVREFTLEYYVDKYLRKIDEDDNELYVPEYQREFIWDNNHQSRFIESIILGLPIPFVFAAEMPESGRLEIVDGSQRIRTLAAYLKDELVLEGLRKLTKLNGLCFSQLSTSRQRKIQNTSLRMVVLSANATEEVRNELFDRINTSSVPLVAMETRRGIYKGEFMSFVTRMANLPEFKRLCPLPKYQLNRREEEELVLRVFAFADAFPDYRRVEKVGVAKYLDEYLKQKNQSCNMAEFEEKERWFRRMVDFANKSFPKQGFAKKKNAIGISRPYFEALAVGSMLALQENPKIVPAILPCLIVDKNHRNRFCNMLDGRYRTHTAKKIKERIEYVKKSYLDAQARI